MERENTTRRPARYSLIDSIRGVAIMGVVLYHFLYDLNIVFGLNPAWVKLPLVQFWQEGTCCLFIMVSGFVWRLGKASCLRRGLQLNLLGLGITLLTFAVAPSQLILFGMLNFMGCAALLMLPLSGQADNLPPLFGMALSLMAFVFFHDVAEGAVGLGALWSVALPEAWYESKILLPLGLPYAGFYSSDYFPLLPWFGMFAFGYYLYAYCRERGALERLAVGETPLLSWAGRHTLKIYLLHQIVCMPLAAAIAYVS
ncbi:MAG: heparan-alpha-glucosaminide N-acetyltransferase domain-containing protein [Phascolarctobacterium sp.]|uniref:heparan-alpha-glucosaminide N-acetyltransferase domain-containing protein n=1 Tax=Phascolarctobacterium sp. TaxID=2049039 RepID=UPI0026DB55FB|nr:heparan-alpha-glucosaminide N-acetyltransferase domain-containing protein [Phascolarctobacterium sp.]MDO4921240.1 heparan-alpha-glucosaminide N-acetyltransferase domain-containing protein [Phascolarctobacterium sp.]